MAEARHHRRRGAPPSILGLGLLAFLLLPVLALALSSSPRQLGQAFAHPLVLPALWLSTRTSLLSLAIIVVTGTPLAWFLARSSSRWTRVLEAAVELPIVIPPAVMGVALLLTFGREGLLAPILGPLGGSLSFSTAAVVVAQVVVAAPFYVQSATSGFRAVDDDLVLVARTLGASRRDAFLRVAVPLALPSIVSGAALSWARAIGEFGATLLFAGSLTGRTQTMPLAIYAALESNVDVATAIALVLALTALAILVAARLARAALGSRVASEGSG